MKLLVDSNVVLDLFLNGRPDTKYSVQLLEYCQLQMLQGFIASFSLPTIIYILRKSYPSPKDQRTIIEAILNSLTPVETPASDLTYPFTHHIKDYEDGLQIAAAEHINAHCIITHNLRDFRNSRIPAITPKDFIDKIIIHETRHLKRKPL